MTNKPQFVGERVQTLLLDCAKLTGKGPSSFEGARCYASTSAVSDGTVHPDQLEQVTYNNRPSRANQIAQAGDVIVARMQATSKVLEVNETNEGFIYSTGFAVLSPHPSIISQRCLFHLLLSPSFKRSKDKLCTGATQKAITNAGFKKLKISFPRRDYQDQAVSKLDHVLGQIKNSEQRLATLDALVKSRFVEMFGNLSQYESQALCSCVHSLESGKSPKCQALQRKGSEPAVLKLSAISSGRYRESENKALPKNVTPVPAKMVCKGDILLARKNTPELVGRSVLVRHTDGNIMFPDIVFRMHPRNDINGVYLAHLLAYPLFESVRVLAHGSAKSMSNIPKSELAQLAIPLPPLPLQQEFADFVAQVDKSRFAQRE